jgi:hypothetical protein
MKRERQRQKSEKATAKRDNRAQREAPTGDTVRVATREDLEGYGLENNSDDDSNEASGAASRERS